MIHKLIEWSLKNRGIVIIVYLGVAVAGYWALVHTPIDAIPDLSDNQVIVFTDWTGRSPQEVEDQVTYPLVTNLQGLPGVRVVRFKRVPKYLSDAGSVRAKSRHNAFGQLF